MAKTPFLTDVKTLRKRARQNLDRGAVTDTYKGDVKKTIELLQSVLATEIVCVLRYTMHAVAATGISSEGVKDEFVFRMLGLREKLRRNGMTMVG